jgi:hypothetical protein
MSAALVSLDLASVLAAQGRFAEARDNTLAARSILEAAGSGESALPALLYLDSEMSRNRATAELVLKVATIEARSRYDRGLRFEHQLP